MKKREILAYLMWFRTILADLMYLSSSKEEKRLIHEDLVRYMLKESTYQTPNVRTMNFCLLYSETFRNVFYFRIHGHGILKAISKIFLKPIATIEIGGKIDGGLRINHKNAVIFPYSAGKNLTIGPNVVIGKGTCHDNGSIDSPIIGDNVRILPNSVVTGGIKIGNDSTVGAGTMLVKSIPDNCTVIGNPAKILEGK